MPRPTKAQENAGDQPIQPTAKGVQPAGRTETAEREFECLFRLFELYSTLHVEGETVYHNRTSIITVTQGLLFVAYGALVQGHSTGVVPLEIALASIGCVLSVLWLLFEQRNAVYYAGRGAVLMNIESELLQRSETARGAFIGMWTPVPAWVKSNARWYQRVSAPLILRVFIPTLFLFGWLLIAVLTPQLSRDESGKPRQVPATQPASRGATGKDRPKSVEQVPNVRIQPHR